ncbi:conserved hypothetical protein [Clostridioides difficile]|uniref:Uncharacterized protein n=1 Tax=Clostridioides difficile TaxID=1496 RepID=A0A069AAK5_CLODI|nr:conserved hypothetical protein [Clostridioides difficile]
MPCRVASPLKQRYIKLLNPPTTITNPKRKNKICNIPLSKFFISLLDIMPTPLKYFIYSIIHYIISFFNKNIIINNIILLLIMQIKKSIIKAFKIHFFLILKAFYILHFYFLYYIL